MKAGPATSTGRPRRVQLAGALLVSSLSLLVIACGITLSAGDDETELFKRLTITGDIHHDSTLTLKLEYAQVYPVDVRAACDLLIVDPDWTPTPKPSPGPTPTATEVVIPKVRPTPSNTLYEILAETLPANPEGGAVDEATPVPGAIERQFTAPGEPSQYIVRCYTPDDVNNAIAERFTIEAPPTPSP